MIPLALFIAQWSVHEIDLSARGRYANPDRNVAVIADFAGPEQVTVQGYWAGETRYKVRFTPTKPGRYTYAVRSHPTDIGLHAEGSFDVEPAAGGFASAAAVTWGLIGGPAAGCPVTRYRLAVGRDGLEDAIREMAGRGAVAELAVDGDEIAARSAVKRYAAFPNVIWRAGSDGVAAAIREADPWAGYGRMSAAGVVSNRRELWTAALARVSGTLADASVCGDLAVLVKFFADRRIALDGGRDIVIYLPDGGPIGRRRGYEGEVFNPRDGSVLPLPFSPPRGQDWVVWLRKR